jgi:hypothetical protein
MPHQAELSAAGNLGGVDDDRGVLAGVIPDVGGLSVERN